ncbi:MAG: aminoacyl-tRNA hydrolase [Flavobacteriales bacterium]
MKYLIVGLGNIGEQYENTRHNIGFKVLDALIESSSSCFETERYGDVAKLKFKGRTLVLLKPSTYMNLSGKAVNYWMQEEKISLSNTMIITDDLALPYGKLRLKGKGSDGGHNGLKNIQEILKTSKYSRLRFGIGDEFSKGKQIDYVLGKWSKEEEENLEEYIELAIRYIKSFSTIGLNRTMNDLNKNK